MKRVSIVSFGFFGCVSLHLLKENDFKNVDDLFRRGQHKEVFHELLRENVDDFNVCWRLARTCYHGARSDDFELSERKEILKQGLAYAEKALKENDQSIEAHKWFGALKQIELEFEINSYLDMFSKIGKYFENLKIARDHYEIGLKLSDGKDWECCAFLGQQCMFFASLRADVRFTVSLLFGNCPKATYEVCSFSFLFF